MAASWQYLDDQGTWRNMLEADSRSLEALFQVDTSIKAEIPLGPHGLRYGADLASMEQINLRTGLHRQIRRVEMARDGFVADTLSTVTDVSESLISEVTIPSLSRSQQLSFQVPEVRYVRKAVEVPLVKFQDSVRQVQEVRYVRKAVEIPSVQVQEIVRPVPQVQELIHEAPRIVPQVVERPVEVQQARTPRSSHEDSLPDSPAGSACSRSSSQGGLWRREFRSTLSSASSSRSRPDLRPPGPATYDKSKHKQALSPRGSVSFGSTRRGCFDSVQLYNQPSPQDYDATSAWQRSSSSRSSSSARMRSPRKQFLLRGDGVMHDRDCQTAPGPATYDTRKYKQALSSTSSATFGRTIRLAAQWCRTPTSDEGKDSLIPSSIGRCSSTLTDEFSQAQTPTRTPEKESFINAQKPNSPQVVKVLDAGSPRAQSVPPPRGYPRGAMVLSSCRFPVQSRSPFEEGPESQSRDSGFLAPCAIDSSDASREFQTRRRSLPP